MTSLDTRRERARKQEPITTLGDNPAFRSLRDKIKTADQLPTPLPPPEPQLEPLPRAEQAPPEKPTPERPLRPIPDTDIEPPHESNGKLSHPKGRSFVGRVASGRGRVVTADDSSYAIEANPPLNAWEHAYAVKHGFDDESPDGSLLIADKKTMREAGGSINHVAMAIIGSDAGRGR